MFKKILLILTFVVLISVMLWGFWGWFVVKDSEQQLRTFLEESFHNDELNSIDAELVKYKIGLTGATAWIKISSKIEFIKEQMGELTIRAKLINGPVLYDDGKILFGKAMWKLLLDNALKETQSSNSSQEKLQEIFKSKIPFMSILINFEDSLSYHSHIRGLSTASLTADHIVSDGFLVTDVLEHNFNVEFKGLNIITESGAIEVPKADLKVSIKKQRTEHRKKITFSTDNFSVNFPKALSDIPRYDINMKGDLFYLNSLLSGVSYVESSPVLSGGKRAESLSKLEVILNKLSVDGYQSYLFAEAETFNLKEQVKWTLEENAETPEGQDHIWHLYDQLEEKKHDVAKIVTRKLFFSDESKLAFTLDLSRHQYAIPSFFKEKLSIFTDQHLFNQVDQNYQLGLKSQKETLLVNGNPMTWELFIKRFSNSGTY